MSVEITMSVEATGKEPCPRCGVLHERGPYVQQEHEANGGAIPVGPNDVLCSCGATLRFTVPLFRVNESGWIWVIR